MSARFSRTAGGLALSLLCCGPLEAAGLKWDLYRRPAPTPRLEPAMVYDSVRQRFVMFGGYETNFGRDGEIWEYEPVGATWTEVTPATGPRPSARNGAAMGYDPLRQRIFLFGGQSLTGQALGDTWQWDCVAKTWTSFQALELAPSQRTGGTLVHDGGADRLLLFGGGYQNDTWAFDLAAREWTEVPTTFSSPSGLPMRPRSYHAAAVNPATQRLVVFGGIDGSAGGVADDLDDLWELRGSVWTEVTPALSPPAGGWRAMAFDDLGRLVLHGGWTNAGTHGYDDTWLTSWNGTVWASWQRIAPPAPSPGGRDSHVMVTDTLRHKILLFGGYLSDLWEFDSSGWHAAAPRWDPGISQEVYAPAKQSDHAMAYDSVRNQVLMFGAGSIEMWRFDLSTRLWYIDRNQAPLPMTRAGHAMAYDAARDRTLLFGGACQRDPWSMFDAKCPVNGSYLPDETWVWNGADRTWTEAYPLVSPPGRSGHGMAYDAARGQVVLFGGSDKNGLLDDTWLWNGSIWTRVPTTVQPSARWGHAMAYDAVRQRVVLFGGFSETLHGDTWEWDGLQWTQAAPTGPAPAARRGATLVGPGDGQAGLLLLGGNLYSTPPGNPASADAWLWNGSAWSWVAPLTPSPSARRGAAAVGAAGKLVLYGGENPPLQLPTEVWIGQLERGEATLTVGDCSANEGAQGACQVGLTLDPAQPQAVTVTATAIDGLARLGFDYGPVPASVTIPAGATHRTLDVPVLDDGLYEGAESFSLDLASPAGLLLSRPRVLGTILDDEPRPSLSIAACSVVEGHTGKVPLEVEVTLTAATERPIFAWVNTQLGPTGGTALVSLDYVRASSELSFPAGSGPRTLPFTVEVYGDHEFEATETVRVAAGGVELAATVRQDCLIVDDDLHPWKIAAIGAFDGNGRPDLLWRDDRTGELRVWLMNGLQRMADVPLNPPYNPDDRPRPLNARPRALADLDGNGTSDIIWHDYTGLGASVWLMNGTTRVLRKSLPYQSDRVVDAAADFGTAASGGAPDGHPDLVARNRESGQTRLQFLNGSASSGTANVSRPPAPAWELVGAADLGNAADSTPDGRTDLLWHDTATGRYVVWIMDGALRLQGFFTTPVTEPDSNWRALGLADFDADGKSDILWQNDTTHELRVWLMDGGVRLASLPLDPATGP